MHQRWLCVGPHSPICGRVWPPDPTPRASKQSKSDGSVKACNSYCARSPDLGEFCVESYKEHRNVPLNSPDFFLKQIWPKKEKIPWFDHDIPGYPDGGIKISSIGIEMWSWFLKIFENLPFTFLGTTRDRRVHVIIDKVSRYFAKPGLPYKNRTAFQGNHEKISTSVHCVETHNFNTDLNLSIKVISGSFVPQ